MGWRSGIHGNTPDLYYSPSGKYKLYERIDREVRLTKTAHHKFRSYTYQEALTEILNDEC